jgi:hypothetical protein
MTVKSLDQSALPARIRDAVASGEFSKAGALWAEYGDEFRKLLNTGGASLRRLDEARQLAEWTRTAALCTRAFARDRLARLAVAGRYQTAADKPKPTRALRG